LGNDLSVTSSPSQPGTARRITRFEQIAHYVSIGQIGVKYPIECNADDFAAVNLSAWVLVVELIPHHFNLQMPPSHQILYSGLLANGEPVANPPRFY
jgi:hypothetical protein